MISFIVNQQVVRTDEHPGMVLLEYLRDVACLSGTKEACREGECGACTVLIGRKKANGFLEYKACASCLLPIGDIEGCHVVTVEGLSGSALTLVQQLIVDHSASQCGFCTPGIVLSLTGFCLASPTHSYADAIDALDGNICRCTGYVAIRNAARALCERLADMDKNACKRTEGLVEAGVLPAWFGSIPDQLDRLPTVSVPATPHGVLVGGGTDLFVQRPEQLMAEDLCFLSQRRDLDYVRVDGDVLRVGGAVTIEDFRLDEAVQRYFPALTKDLLLHSSTLLRNKATLTGNLVNASPIGDVTIILLALDARLEIGGGDVRGMRDTRDIGDIGDRRDLGDGGGREVPLEGFFLGYKKVDLGCGEFVQEIRIPLLPKDSCYHFEKVSNRVHLDIAAVNTAMRLTRGTDGAVVDLRVSAGGVGPVPFLVAGMEQFQGRKVDGTLADAVAEVAFEAAKPIDDIRGSAKYKKLLMRQLVRACFDSIGEVA